MILTAVEPVMFHSGPVDGVCQQDYQITYGHLINSLCLDFEQSISSIYYTIESTKKLCQFCFVKLPLVEQNKYEFCTAWYSICKIQCVNMNYYGCRETLITSSFREMDYRGCTEQFLKCNMQLQLENEVIVENVF